MALFPILRLGGEDHERVAANLGPLRVADLARRAPGFELGDHAVFGVAIRHGKQPLFLVSYEPALIGMFWTRIGTHTGIAESGNKNLEWDDFEWGLLSGRMWRSRG